MTKDPHFLVYHQTYTFSEEDNAGDTSRDVLGIFSSIEDAYVGLENYLGKDRESYRGKAPKIYNIECPDDDFFVIDEIELNEVLIKRW